MELPQRWHIASDGRSVRLHRIASIAPLASVLFLLTLAAIARVVYVGLYVDRFGEQTASLIILIPALYVEYLALVEFANWRLWTFSKDGAEFRSGPLPNRRAQKISGAALHHLVLTIDLERTEDDAVWFDTRMSLILSDSTEIELCGWKQKDATDTRLRVGLESGSAQIRSALGLPGS